VFALRKYVFTFSVRLSEEEKAILEQLLKKHCGYMFRSSKSEKFRVLLRKMENKLFKGS
jgi:hypothetical protein